MKSENSGLISILMPVKNTASYLSECLDSIISQTETQWELIAVDDHSTDASLKILEQYARKENRIQVFQNEMKGVIGALICAEKNASGEFITRMDSDDIMVPQKLSLLKAELLSRGRRHIAIGLVSYFSETALGDGYIKYAQWLNGLTTKENNYAEIYKECVIPSPCWMVYREDLGACGGMGSKVYPEDYDLCFRFYKSGYKIAGVQEILHAWRDHAQRSSRTQEHYSDNRFLDLKVKYFVELDYDPNRTLVIWGAGKKGKAIARKLIEKQVRFVWLSNNEKKVGHMIYEQRIMNEDHLRKHTKAQVIVTVANPAEQHLLLEELKLQEELKVYLFC